VCFCWSFFWWRSHGNEEGRPTRERRGGDFDECLIALLRGVPVGEKYNNFSCFSVGEGERENERERED
jgi:hypothetical protein